MEKKKTYLYIYVCMAALLFVGAAISLSVGSAETVSYTHLTLPTIYSV